MIIVSIEGPDFSGKSTIATALLMKLREQGLKAERTALPSRLITGMFADLLRNSKDKISPEVFSLVYAADHLHHYLSSKDKPKTDILILERSSLSYYVYEGMVLGVDMDWLKELNKFNGMKPNLTIIPKTPYKELLRRKGIRLGSEDIFEADDFLKKVSTSFYDLPDWIKNEYNVEYLEYKEVNEMTDEIIQKVLSLLKYR